MRRLRVTVDIWRDILFDVIDLSQRLWQWCFAKSKKTLLLETLQDANCFEEWEAAAMQLDVHLDYDLW